MLSRSTIAIVASLVLTSASGCTKQQPLPAVGASAQSATPLTVQAATVRIQAVARSTSIPFTIEGDQHVQITSRIAGHVSEVSFDIGDQVVQGEILAVLHVPELDLDIERQQHVVAEALRAVESRQADQQLAQAELAEQQALLELRQLELRRISGLVEAGALEPPKRDEAQFAVAAASAGIRRVEASIESFAARVRQAEAQGLVEQSELKRRHVLAAYRRTDAPFDGRITARHVDPGAFVEPAGGKDNTALLELESSSWLQLVLFLPLADAALLDAGDEVTIGHLRGSPDWQQPPEALKIARTSWSFEQGSRMMRAEVDLDNGNGQLVSGDYGVARIALHTYQQPVVTSQALIHGAGRVTEVLRVDLQGTVERVAVQVLYDDGQLAVIGRGLKAGDRVLTSQLDLVREGDTLDKSQLQFSDR